MEDRHNEKSEKKRKKKERKMSYFEMKSKRKKDNGPT